MAIFIAKTILVDRAIELRTADANGAARTAVVKGGGGEYYWDPACGQSDDGSLYIRNNDREALIGGGCWVLDVGSASRRTVETVTDLRNTRGGNDEVVQLLGYSSNNDGGEGQFCWDSSVTASDDDGGTVFFSSGGGWRRLYSGALNVQWFGAKGDGTTDDTSAIQACVDVAGSRQVFVPAGTYLVTSQVTLTEDIEIMGEGAGTVLDLTDASGKIATDPFEVVKGFTAAVSMGDTTATLNTIDAVAVGDIIWLGSSEEVIGAPVSYAKDVAIITAVDEGTNEVTFHRPTVFEYDPAGAFSPLARIATPIRVVIRNLSIQHAAGVSLQLKYVGPGSLVENIHFSEPAEGTSGYGMSVNRSVGVVVRNMETKWALTGVIVKQSVECALYDLQGRHNTHVVDITDFARDIFIKNLYGRENTGSMTLHDCFDVHVDGWVSYREAGSQFRAVGGSLRNVKILEGTGGDYVFSISPYTFNAPYEDVPQNYDVLVDGFKFDTCDRVRVRNVGRAELRNIDINGGLSANANPTALVGRGIRATYVASKVPTWLDAVEIVGDGTQEGGAVKAQSGELVVSNSTFKDLASLSYEDASGSTERRTFINCVFDTIDDIIKDPQYAGSTDFYRFIDCVFTSITNLQTSLRYRGLDVIDCNFDGQGDYYTRSTEIVSGLYDFAVDGGAQGDIILGWLPDNAVIKRAWYEVLTPFASGGAAEVAFGVDTNDAEGLKAAAAFGHADYAAGYHDFTPDGSAANFTTKTTDQREIIMTISVADLTAGKVRVWCEYAVSE